MQTMRRLIWSARAGALLAVLLAIAIPCYPNTCAQDQRPAPVKAVCGRIRDISDTPANEVAVTLFREDGTAFRVVKTVNGEFDFGPVPKGKYVMRIEHSGFLYGERNIFVTRNQDARCDKKAIDIKVTEVACLGYIHIKVSK